MKRLKAVWQQFKLRRKEKSVSTRTFDYVFEDPTEEDAWPTYDPKAYEFESPYVN